MSGEQSSQSVAEGGVLENYEILRERVQPLSVSTALNKR